MDQKEKRQLETNLHAMGFAGVRDPALYDMLADAISNWPGDKHEFFRQVLNECETAEQRSACYQCLEPRLKFKALPLASYEAQTALKAGEAVSQGRMRVDGEKPKPIEVGGKKVIPAERGLADGALATVQCRKCGKVERYLAKTPVQAMTAARRAGWVRQPGINREFCPDCSAKEKASEIVALSRTEHLIVTDRRKAT